MLGQSYVSFSRLTEKERPGAVKGKKWEACNGQEVLGLLSRCLGG